MQALDRWVGPLIALLVDALDGALEILGDLAPAPLRPSPLPLPPLLAGLLLVWALDRVGRRRARVGWTEQVA